jgi:ketosteroid isomerase-like protein
VYKASVRWLVKRAVGRLSTGDDRMVLALLAKDATLSFPGDNSWSDQFRPVVAGREVHITHQDKDEFKVFLQRFVDAGIRMEIEDILVNGPPWNTRVAIRAHVWAPGPDGDDVYTNRAVLFATSRWGKIHAQEDYEDTERSAGFDKILTEAGRTPRSATAT